MELSERKDRKELEPGIYLIVDPGPGPGCLRCERTKERCLSCGRKTCSGHTRFLTVDRRRLCTECATKVGWVPPPFVRAGISG